MKRRDFLKIATTTALVPYVGPAAAPPAAVPAIVEPIVVAPQREHTLEIVRSNGFNITILTYYVMHSAFCTTCKQTWVAHEEFSKKEFLDDVATALRASDVVGDRLDRLIANLPPCPGHPDPSLAPAAWEQYRRSLQ